MSDFARATSLAAYHEFAVSQQLDPAALLKEAGLPADVLEHPENLISYRKFVGLLELSALHSANPLFALQYGLHQGVGVFGSLLYLIRNAKNVGEALLDLGRYFHLHNSAAEVVLELHGAHAIVCYTNHEQRLIGLRHASELAVGVGHQLFRTLLGSRWQPQTVMFQHAPVARPASYRRLLGLTPQFNSAYDAWVFDSKLLSIPLSSADEALHQLMQKHLDSLGRLSSNELPGYVQQLLRSFLPSGRVTLEQVAGYMMISARSLQRHLNEEGTSFQWLLDQTRQSMAERYLRDSTVSLTQLAELLGYSDLSAFSRAFQRWFGVSPRQWKKQQHITAPNRLCLPSLRHSTRTL